LRERLRGGKDFVGGVGSELFWNFGNEERERTGNR
jgi:hypothetical protein